MSFKINAGSLMASRYLKVEDKGIVFCNTDLFGAKKFRYDQIDYIYLSPKSVLSFQVGKEVFSLPIEQTKQEHQQALAAFVEAVKQTRGTGPSIPGPAFEPETPLGNSAQ